MAMKTQWKRHLQEFPQRSRGDPGPERELKESFPPPSLAVSLGGRRGQEERLSYLRFLLQHTIKAWMHVKMHGKISTMKAPITMPAMAPGRR